MDNSQHNSLVNFIWGIADDVLRDVYVRGKYRDVILPMTVIRRLDCLLEPTHDAVLAMKEKLDKAKIANQGPALAQAAKQPFYNTSLFTLRRLLDKPKQLKANFGDYLDGFSPNVQEILLKFKFGQQLDTLNDADALGQLVEKFISPNINLSPNAVVNGDGKEKHPGLTNHGMGYVFEELIRKFNEENNEEAGEHFTPREVVELMARLIFLPVAKELTSGTYLLYDGACGTGGMLTVAEETLHEIAKEHGKKVAIHLHGQEINAETYAICKADLLLKGEGDEAENIKFGSTLSADAFPSLEFDFMLSNPPYGKSWTTDLDRICGGNKKDMSDPRFVVEHQSTYGNEPELNLVTRSSDGQLMFLVNKLAKMKRKSKLGSRIAEVHNGSSLFTGDAGQGESNVRRWIIENDWLEAIIALPLNMFYNTGIATYIWVLTNKKPDHRKGKVQLVDATQWFCKLRKNLGQKNCELRSEDIQRITDVFLASKETEQSKIFPNEAFGYWKVTVERPLRLRVDLSPKAIERFHIACIAAKEQPLAKLMDRVVAAIGPGPHMDYGRFEDAVSADAEEHALKLTAKRRTFIRNELSQKDESGKPVVRKKTKPKKGDALEKDATLYGRHLIKEDGKSFIVEYESDSDLRDTEQIPLLERGGISAFFGREVLPHVSDAWIDESKTVVGYEIPFPQLFYKHQPLRSLSEIAMDIRAIEQETDGLLQQITGGVS
jgi:type I restriction enzyme M protein